MKARPLENQMRMSKQMRAAALRDSTLFFLALV